MSAEPDARSRPAKRKTASARPRGTLSLQEQAELLDLAHDAIFVRSVTDSVILYWNRGAEQLYGWTAEEALGRVSHELLQTRFPAPLPEIEAELLERGDWRGDVEHTCRDGRVVLVASHWSVSRDQRGRPRAFLELNRDITARRKTMLALERASED